MRMLVMKPGTTTYAGVTVDCSRTKLEAMIDRFARDAKKAMTVAAVVEMLVKDCGAVRVDQHRGGTVMLEVSPWKLRLSENGQDRLFRAGGANKPGINQIRDWRRKQAPFLKDGSCRG